MSTQLHPGVFWRIVDESGAGPDSVTLVFRADDETSEALQLETDVVTSEYRFLQDRKHVDLAWNQDDIELFQTLLAKQFPDRIEGDQSLRLNLEDDDVQETIAVLAAARFSPEQDGRDWLTGRDWPTLHPDYEVGDMVTLETREGFCLGVLVALDAVEARVVLLECTDAEGQHREWRLHELVSVERGHLLPDTFGNVMVSEQDILH